MNRERLLFYIFEYPLLHESYFDALVGKRRNAPACARLSVLKIIYLFHETNGNAANDEPMNDGEEDGTNATNEANNEEKQ
jgi:hypothetical protein